MSHGRGGCLHSSILGASCCRTQRGVPSAALVHCAAYGAQRSDLELIYIARDHAWALPSQRSESQTIAVRIQGARGQRFARAPATGQRKGREGTFWRDAAVLEERPHTRAC